MEQMFNIRNIYTLISVKKLIKQYLSLFPIFSASLIFDKKPKNNSRVGKRHFYNEIFCNLSYCLRKPLAYPQEGLQQQQSIPKMASTLNWQDVAKNTCY